MDKRYQAMMKVSLAIMTLVGLSGLYLFVLAIVVCHKKCKARCRLRKEPPELSSDEEDDKNFLLTIRSSLNLEANAANSATVESRHASDGNLLLN